MKTKGCLITNRHKHKVNIIAKSRSKVTRRTKSYQNANLQNKKFELMVNNSFVRIKIKNLSVRAIRTITKYQGIVNFLLNYKCKTPEFLKLKKKIF